MTDEDQGPSQDDPLAKAKVLRAAGASIAQVRQYLTSKGYAFGDAPPPGPITPGHSKFTPQQLVARADRQVTNAAEDAAATAPSYAQQVLGGLAAFSPGTEFAQAGFRSLVRDQPYGDALEDVRQGVAAAPAPVRFWNQNAGDLVALNALLGHGPLATMAAPASAAVPLAQAAAPLADMSAGSLSREAIAQRLALGQQQAPELAPSARPAGQALQELLQRSLDEGAPGEMVKGYPIRSDPPTNWDLMQQIEDALLKAKGSAAPRNVPRWRSAGRP